MSESQAKFTNDDLKKLQALSLEEKIQISKARIIEWYEAYNGQVYVSFSGGKDSTVLLDLVRKIYPDVPAVFIDTGLEYPEIREFVKTKENVAWLKPEMNFRKVIETYGYPIISKDVSQQIYEARKCPNGRAASRFDRNSEYNIKYKQRYSVERYKYLLESEIPISHMCCHVMKKTPAKKYEKETGRKTILGTMTCESALRKTRWLQNGCNAFDAKRPTSQPLSFWTEQDVLEYILKYNLLYAPVYGEIKKGDNGKYYTTKCDRTGCVFCAYAAHLEKEPNRFQRLKQTHPKLWDYCMRPWNRGGLGMREVLDYIGVKTE